MTNHEKEFEEALEQAILLALLEKKHITLWQYEQCSGKGAFIDDTSGSCLLPCFYRQQ